MNYIAFLFTAASIVGTLANSFQKKWCFYIWLCTNSFWCIYNTINAQYAQALLYVFNLATCIIGLYKWRRPVQIAADLSNGHDKGCIVEYRKTKSGIDVLSCKYDDGAATDTENNATLRGDNLKELVLPPLRRCKHCGKTGVYYGENFGGGASMRAEAIIKHHNAYNAKRYRTRKKNLARLHREYKKYIKKGGGRK